jgi:DNA-binding NtrC family response regulator
MRRVLVVDDEENLRRMLQTLLKREGYDPVGVPSVDSALLELGNRPYDIIITDLRMPGRGGMDLVDEVRRRNLDATVVVMTAFGSKDVAIEAMKRGAYDYLSKPFEADELILLLRKAEERERLFRENQSLARQVRSEGTQPEGPFGDFVARSSGMLELFRTVRKIAEFKTTVLIDGESGTGKELVARAIHSSSPRARAAFIAVNCGAIPINLLESELFGHRKGAFTDASRDRKGLFEEASGGTLFLDEIGELPLGLQVKLLRVLQEGEIRRLGDSQDIKVDVRVVAATARDLADEVKRGAFREDLYYRLNVFALHLPALRDRREDIPLLADHFLHEFTTAYGRRPKELTAEAYHVLGEYHWPGNVRELKNLIERIVILNPQVRVDARHIPLAGTRKPQDRPLDRFGSLQEVREAAERDYILRKLEETSGNVTRTAELLGLERSNLYRKMKTLGIGPKE